MGLPKTIRFNDELEKQLEEYMEFNGIKFSQLLHLALTKFITETQNIQLKPVELKTFMETAEKAYIKHKDAIDRLK